jgi:hypothetical protein
VGSRLGRRRLLQALGGVAGFATLGSPVTGSGGRVRAQTSGDGPWAQRGKLTATDGDAGDLLGASVAVDDGTILVGAFSDVDGQSADEQAADDVGSAYVFTRSGGLTQQAKLTASDGDADDSFGRSVAINRDTAVIGAEFDEDPNGDGAGSAYVFTRSGEEWTQQAKLTASDGDNLDLFGESVAVDRDTAVVGAGGDEDPNGEDAGSAYVFTRSGEEWTQQAKLTASDGDPGDRFGTSVAVDRDTAVIGANFDEDPNGEDAGSAYVFTRSEGEWTQQAKLTASDGETNDNFGVSVAVDKDTAVVGAEFDANPNAGDAGSAYVFVRSGEEWTRQAELIASDGDNSDFFGASVAVDCDTAVVGAREDEDPNGEGDEPFSGAGSAYVFSRSEGNWAQQNKLAADDGDAGDDFGESVAVDGETIVVGARTDENQNGPAAGSAYVFGIEAPRPAVRPILGATVKQLGSPDGQARVQYGISAVVEEPTLVLEFTNVRSELSVNADDSDTAGIFRSGNRQVQFPDPCKETTATIAFDIAGEASAEEQFDIDARLLDETGTATSSATVTVGGGGEGSTTAAVELTAVPDGLQQYNITLSGPSDTSITEVQSNALSGNFFQVTDGGPGSSSVTARAVDLDDTIQPGAGQQCLFTVTYDQSVPLSTLSVTVNELLDDDGNPISAGQVSLTDDSTPFPNGLPGTGSQPADPDNDGVFEDVDGDGEADFDDAIETGFVQSDQLNSEQVAALDFDGDGDFDFDDAIELAFQTSG